MNVRRMPMSNLNDIFFTPAANQELTYDQVLEDVQRYFAENHASTIAEAGEGNAERATSLLKELMEHYIVKRKYTEICSRKGACGSARPPLPTMPDRRSFQPTPKRL